MFRLAHPSPEPPFPLLITGIAGVAGYNAWHYFQSLYPGRVFGLRQRDNWRLVGEGILACDAEDCEELSRLFAEHRFAAVLNCAGNCALKSCELDPQMARRINVAGVQNLLDVMNSAPPVRLVHLSIDLVYSGVADGGYIETDPTDPVTVYGKTMAEAEQLVLEQAPDACILRISLPMGVSFNGHAGAIDWIQSRFKKGRPATLYFDEVRTPTYTDCLNQLFAHVLAQPVAGLFHAGGARRLSLYQIAQIINRVGGYHPDCLKGCPRVEAGPMPPRAGNVAMESLRLWETLGSEILSPWPWDEAFVPTHPDWHRERPAGEERSYRRLTEILYSHPGKPGLPRPSFPPVTSPGL
jgi:dTDP-4-dehydrorhamnose reductase